MKKYTFEFFYGGMDDCLVKFRDSFRHTITAVNEDDAYAEADSYAEMNDCYDYKLVKKG